MANVAADVLAPVATGAPRPFWTVIITTYKRTHFLSQCMASVLDQAPPPEEMEIILHDDYSDTDFRPLVETLGRNRVRAYRTTAQRGLYGNVNDALAKSTGQWIHIIHDDDFVLPGFYRTMQNALVRQSDNVAIACCQYTNIYEQKGTTWSPQPFRDGPGIIENWLDSLIITNPLNVSAVVYRRSIFEQIGRFREDLPFTGDWEYYIRAATQFAWWYQPENLARFRVHGQSQTDVLAQQGRTASDIRRTLEIAETYLPEDVKNRSLPQARMHQGQEFYNQAASALTAKPQPNISLGLTLLKECIKLGGDFPLSDNFMLAMRHPLVTPLLKELITTWREVHHQAGK